jgi:hypothetical protein
VTTPRRRWPGLRWRKDRRSEDAENDQRIHNVEPGESLSLIADRYYGDVTRYREIADANGVPGPDYSIEVGQQLIIPGDVAKPSGGTELSSHHKLTSERRGQFRGKRVQVPQLGRLFNHTRRREEAFGTRMLDPFQLSGSVGATTKRKVGQSMVTIRPENKPRDVKLVQEFLVAAGYLDGEHIELHAVSKALTELPNSGIPEGRLTATIAAIIEWQRLGATGNDYKPDGLIAGDSDRAASHASIFTGVYNKYANEPLLDQTKMVLSTEQWHTQARYGFNYQHKQDELEKEYIVYVREVTGIQDPAELHRASVEDIEEIKANRKFSEGGKTSFKTGDVIKYGIRATDKERYSKPNWVCCFDTAKKMLSYTGASPHGETEKIQTFVGVGAKGQFTPHAYIGFRYIDGQLKHGKAVFVGVDKGVVKTINELITDHFIVIVGKDRDDEGWYFRYFDPASTSKSVGTSEDNKLRIGEDFESVANDSYRLSQIRVNEEEGI